jgi:hypothetical protein
MNTDPYAEYNRKRRVAAKAEGICQSCLKREAMPGFRRVGVHLERTMARTEQPQGLAQSADRRDEDAMKCRALDCHNEAMPISQDHPERLCGSCQEANEVNPVPLKRQVDPAVIEKRNETKRRNLLAKLEWAEERVRARKLGRTG